jgi:hypothetical protein
MLTELIPGISLCIAIFFFILAVGNELFMVMIAEQLRYLLLIIHNKPLPPAVSIPQRPEPVS